MSQPPASDILVYQKLTAAADEFEQLAGDGAQAGGVGVGLQLHARIGGRAFGQRPQQPLQPHWALVPPVAEQFGVDPLARGGGQVDDHELAVSTTTELVQRRQMATARCEHAWRSLRLRPAGLTRGGCPLRSGTTFLSSDAWRVALRAASTLTRG